MWLSCLTKYLCFKWTMHYTSVPCSKALQIWSLTANYSCLLCQISAYNRQLGVCLHSSLCFTNFLILITFNFTFSNWRGKETQKRLTHNVFSTFSSLKLDSWTFTKAVKYWYCRVYWGVHLETTTTKKTNPCGFGKFPSHCWRCVFPKWKTSSVNTWFSPSDGAQGQI